MCINHQKCSAKLESEYNLIFIRLSIRLNNCKFFFLLQLLRSHDDAFQGSTSYPDAFYFGLCQGGNFLSLSILAMLKFKFSTLYDYSKSSYHTESAKPLQMQINLLTVIKCRVNDHFSNNCGQVACTMWQRTHTGHHSQRQLQITSGRHTPSHGLGYVCR